MEILISAVVAWLVSFVTTKMYIDHIDSYVKVVFAELQKLVKDIQGLIKAD